MLTRRKNRVKKNGKKRYMSRKMRGAGNLFTSYETQFKGKYKQIDKNRDELIRNIDKLNINIDFIHSDIEKAINNIIVVKKKKLISDEFDANVKKFLEELHKYYEQIRKTGNASVLSAIKTILSVSAIETILSVSAFGTIASAATTPTEKTAFASAIETIVSVSAIGTIATTPTKNILNKIADITTKMSTQTVKKIVNFATIMPDPTATKIEQTANEVEKNIYDEIIIEEMTKIKNDLNEISIPDVTKIEKALNNIMIPDKSAELNNILDISKKNKDLLKSLFKYSSENINKVFGAKKNEYDKVQTNKTFYKNNINKILSKVKFTFTEKLINCYNDIYIKINDVKTADLKKIIYIINKSSDNNSPVINKPVVESMYDTSDVYIDKIDDIAYIFYRLHDVELEKTFLEEWIKVLKEEKEKAEKERKEKERKEKERREKEEKDKKDGGGKLVGGTEENQIENKLKELLSNIYRKEERDKIQNEFDKISKATLDEKIKAVNDIIYNVTDKIKKYKTIKNTKASQQIIYKIITSKIEEESNKPEYTDVMTRENALKILHVYDDKNSKEIKDKYKMTKDMWTDILNNVTEKDRKPLIYKILNKVKHAYDTLYQDKETTIDINFYKSVFNNNPFPYKELINVTRTGEGVTPIIYGVEELFKLYEDELKFIKDNNSKDAVKPPLKQKKIEITHKRKNPEFPRIFDSST